VRVCEGRRGSPLARAKNAPSYHSLLHLSLSYDKSERNVSRMIDQAVNRIANRKSSRYVRAMSAIGFSASSPSELDQLREACGSLNDVARNFASAEKCIKKQDLRMAEHHLRAAEWHVVQAKQRIAAVGRQNRPQS